MDAWKPLPQHFTRLPQTLPKDGEGALAARNGEAGCASTDAHTCTHSHPQSLPKPSRQARGRSPQSSHTTTQLATQGHGHTRLVVQGQLQGRLAPSCQHQRGPATVAHTHTTWLPPPRHAHTPTPHTQIPRRSHPSLDTKTHVPGQSLTCELHPFLHWVSSVPGGGLVPHCPPGP